MKVTNNILRLIATRDNNSNSTNNNIMYIRSIGSSTEGDTSGTTTPTNPKHTMTIMKDPKLKAPLRKNAMIRAKIWYSSKERNRVLNQMQRRLIILWSACVRYKDLQILQPKQDKDLALWEHILNCRDKDCKRTRCQSSCRIMRHFNRCKLLNQRSTCKLCSPVMRHIIRKSCVDNRLSSKQYDKNPIMEKKKQMGCIMIYDSSKNQPLTGYKPKQITGVTKRIRCSDLPQKRQKRQCTVIRWSKSVKGGLGADSVLHNINIEDTKNAFTQKHCCATIQCDKCIKVGMRAYSAVQGVKVNGVKNSPLLLQHAQKYARTKTCKKGQEIGAWNPNLTASSKTHHEKQILSGISNVFTGGYIMEVEEKREIFDTSIALLSLKKRKWDNITTEPSTALKKVPTYDDCDLKIKNQT